MKLRFIFKSLLLMYILQYAGPSYAFVSNVIQYVSQYQIGIDYANSMDTVELSYKTDVAGGVPTTCQIDAADPTKKRCAVHMIGGSSSGWGIFLQRAFKKQGFWYFDYDIGFGARYLNGAMAEKDASLSGLPLREAKFSLGSVLAKPYIQVGVTPDRWPDILLSFGPAAQVAFGKVTINSQPENTVFGTSSYSGPMSLWRGFVELELVLKRFGEGAFSVFSSTDVTGEGEGTKIYPKSIDTMTDFRGKFSRNVSGQAFGFGLKLVTSWP